MTDNLWNFIAENSFLTSIGLGLIVFIIVHEVKQVMRKYKEIDPNKAVQLLNNDDTLILDVREATELTAGKILGAKPFPVSTSLENLDDIEQYKEHPVIAFCSNGLKANKFCNMLTKHGFKDVYHLKGGLTAWDQANLPVIKQ